MTTIQVLEAARARIAKGWIKGEAVRVDDDGRAVAWCASGAIHHAATSTSTCTGCSALDLVERANDDAHVRGLAAWNDAPERTQTEVLAVFDKAIQLARSAG